MHLRMMIDQADRRRSHVFAFHTEAAVAATIAAFCFPLLSSAFSLSGPDAVFLTVSSIDHAIQQHDDKRQGHTAQTP